MFRKLRHLTFSSWWCLVVYVCLAVAVMPGEVVIATIYWQPTLAPMGTSVNIPNPMRGYEQGLIFSTSAQDPNFAPEQDAYARWSWSQIETSQGVYDFTVIDNALNGLASGQRLGFRIMAISPCYSYAAVDVTVNGTAVVAGIDMPSYLMQGKAWYAPMTGMSGCSYGATYQAMPDWNDPVFLKAVTTLLNALGARYGTDKRISFIDIGIFGDWGEWHIDPIFQSSSGKSGNFPYCDSNYNTTGALLPTEMTREAIVDAHINAFPYKRLIMTTGENGDGSASLFYTLNKSTLYPIGLRRDSWSHSIFSSSLLIASTYAMPNNTPTPGGVCTATSATFTGAQTTQILNLWQTAPFIAENYSGSGAFSDNNYVNQVLTCHVTAIDNGSWGSTYANLPSQIQEGLTQIGVAMGFRLTTDLANFSVSADNSTLNFETIWVNNGIAPPYINWPVTIYLWNPITNTRSSSNISPLKMTSVLPANSYGTCSDTTSGAVAFAKPTFIHDTLPMANITSGVTYQLRIIIPDPDRYSAPIALDLQTKNNDGSYTLGTLSVSIPPTVAISASPNNVAYRGGTTLTWSSTNATSCLALGGWTGSRESAGSASISNLAASTTYTLTCTGAGGSSSQSATVTVGALNGVCETSSIAGSGPWSRSCAASNGRGFR